MESSGKLTLKGLQVVWDGTIKPVKGKKVVQPAPEQLDREDDPAEKVANWFKDLFNICGKTSCCNSQKTHPYYDNKTWTTREQ